MSDEIQETEQQYVEIFGEDGQIIKCEIYDIVDFEDKTYAMLLPLSEAGIITVSSVPKYPTADDVDLSIRLNSKSPMRIARW